MTWAGALALFVSAGFFVKYAIDNEWLGQTARVVLGIVGGLVLLVAGDRFVRRGMRALGQGMIGGGLAVLYVSLFAAFALYKLMPQPVAFGSMAAVAAAAIALAVLHDALPISVLAAIGAFLTPVMLSTGRDARDALFAYLTIVDLGVLGLAFFKNWRVLGVLAFIGTAGLFAGWFAQFYTPEALVPALLWLGVFYLIFLVLPFTYGLWQKAPAAIDRFLVALAAGTGAFGYANYMLYADHRHVLGFVALGMGACYAAIGSISRRRVPDDVPTQFGFIALAVAFITLAVPLHLNLSALTLVWAIEGPVLLYLGYRFSYLPVRIFGFIVLSLAVPRLFAVHYPLHEQAFLLLWNRPLGTALCVPLAAAAFAIIHHAWRKQGGTLDRVFRIAAALGSGILALVLLHVEFDEWFALRIPASIAADAPSARMWFPVVLWTLGSAAYMAAGVKARSLAARITAIALLMLALIFCARAYCDGGRYLVFANARFIVSLAAALLPLVYAAVIHRGREAGSISPDERPLVAILAATGGVALLVLLSAETYGYCAISIADPQRAAWMAMLSLSIVWGIYAIAALAVGFWRRTRPVRFAALGLFGLTALKLVLADLAELQQLYRIISFVALGLLMIGASYLYHRVEKMLQTPQEGNG